MIDSLEQGGAEQSLAAIWPYLEENDVDMSFAIFRDSEGPPRRRLEELGATIKILGSASCIGRVRELRSLLREHPVDVVHTSLFEADAVGRMAGRWAGVPVVSTLVSTAPSDPALPRWKQRLVWIFEAGTARLTCRFHAVTAAVADAQSARLRLPRDRVSVVWRGRDRADLGEPATERRRTVRARLDVNRTATIIIAVGRHVPAKGLDVAIGALG